MTIQKIFLECRDATLTVRAPGVLRRIEVGSEFEQPSQQLFDDYTAIIAAEQGRQERPSVTLEQLADRLTNEILTGAVARDFVDHCEKHLSVPNRAPLEIRVDGDPWFLNLPWELLRIGNKWLLREYSSVSVVRRPLIRRGTEPPGVERQQRNLQNDPIRVLFLPAECHDRPVYWQEARCEMERRLWFWEQAGHLQIVSLHDPRQPGTLESLSRLLQNEKPFDVLYLLAHGHGSPRPMIEFVGNDGRRSMTDFNELVSTMEGGRLPRLLILSSCHLSQVNEDLGGVAREAVSRGVEAVLAMQSTVSALGAGAAAAAMLDSLIRGRSLGPAVHDSRTELARLAPKRRGEFTNVADGEWSLPAIWMRENSDAESWTLTDRPQAESTQQRLKKIFGSDNPAREAEAGLAAIRCLQAIQPEDDQGERHEQRSWLGKEFRQKIVREIENAFQYDDLVAAASYVFNLSTRVDDPEDESFVRRVQDHLAKQLNKARHCGENWPQSLEELRKLDRIFEVQAANAKAYHLTAIWRPTQLEASREEFFIRSRQHLEQAYEMLAAAQLTDAAQQGEAALDKLGVSHYAFEMKIDQRSPVFSCAAALADVHGALNNAEPTKAYGQLCDNRETWKHAVAWFDDKDSRSKRWQRLKRFVKTWADATQSLADGTDRDNNQQEQDWNAILSTCRTSEECLQSLETELKNSDSTAWLFPLSDDQEPSTIAQAEQLRDRLLQLMADSLAELQRQLARLQSLQQSQQAFELLLLESDGSDETTEDIDRNRAVNFVCPQISQETLNRIRSTLSLSQVDSLDDPETAFGMLGDEVVDFFVARRRTDLIKSLLVRLRVRNHALDPVVLRIATNVFDAKETDKGLSANFSLGACCTLLASDAWCKSAASENGEVDASLIVLHNRRQMRSQLAHWLAERPTMFACLQQLDLPFSSEYEHREAMYLAFDTADALESNHCESPNYAQWLQQLWEAAVHHASNANYLDVAERHLMNAVESHLSTLQPEETWSNDDWPALDSCLEVVEAAYLALRGTTYEHDLPSVLSRLLMSRGALALRNSGSMHWLDVAREEFTNADRIAPSLEITAGRCAALLLKAAQTTNSLDRADLIEQTRTLTQPYELEHNELLALVRQTVELACGTYDPRYETFLSNLRKTQQNPVDLSPIDRAHAAFRDGHASDAARFLLDALQLGSSSAPQLETLASNALTGEVEQLLAPRNYPPEHLLRESLHRIKQFQKYFPDNDALTQLAARLANCLPGDSN